MFSPSEDIDTIGLGYDLYEIEESGELIAITISGPDTYFEYKGKGFGLQHDLAEEFANSIGVRLRMEVAHDTAEVLQRLREKEVDLVAMVLPAIPGAIHCKNNWLVNTNATLLAQAIDDWYTPNRLEKQKEKQTAPQQVRRKARPMMMNAATGQICQYDAQFQKHAGEIGWDWRLLAAQCYQESAFDPQAVSWAGAQGLMQIMPGTAEHLNLEQNDIFDPEKNIEAGVRYLRELSQTFTDIPGQSNRIPFILAAYNGGANHVRDAMALARKNGKNDKVWREVEPYILNLSSPQYYNDPVVTSGYLRGNETYDYVRNILDRWAQYRGQARNHSKASIPTPAKHSKHPTQVRKPEGEFGG